MFNDKEKDRIYRVQASPAFWRKKAEELKYSAEILKPHCDDYLKKIAEVAQDESMGAQDLPLSPCDSLFGLMAYSAETLLKGYIIKNDPGLVSNGKLGDDLITHDLFELVERAEIDLNKEEEVFLENANRYVAGDMDFRYPVGKEYKDPLERHKGISIGGDPLEALQSLFDRLSSEMGDITTARKK